MDGMCAPLLLLRVGNLKQNYFRLVVVVDTS